jgi:hypothetical protein
VNANDSARELHALWGGEYDEVELRYEPEHYSNHAYWVVTLVARSERMALHSTDWVTLRWQFYGESIEESLYDALRFARDLDALRPEEEE